MSIWLVIKSWFLSLFVGVGNPQQALPITASTGSKAEVQVQHTEVLKKRVNFKDSVEIYTKGEYDWRIVYAVGKLESRNGKSILSKSIHNYFNVTATKKQPHKEVTVDGKTFRFIKYESMQESIKGFQTYLEGKKGKYWEGAIQCLKHPSKPREFFECLRRSGYADENYPVETLLNIYNEASE
jgi:flagellum-specific peptidoglycan hydrolase FlgJ